MKANSREAMDLYFAMRLAFVDRPNVRLRTQEGRPDCIQVVVDERLESLVFPVRVEADYWLDEKLPEPEDITTLGPSPPIQLTGAAEMVIPLVRPSSAAGLARKMRLEYDRKWREELT